MTDDWWCLPKKHNDGVRQLTRDGVMVRVAGSGSKGLTDGRLTSGQLHNAARLALARDHQALYVPNRRKLGIHKISSDKQLITLAGTGAAG